MKGLYENGEPKDVLDGNGLSDSTLKMYAQVPVTIKNLKITGGSGRSNTVNTRGGGIYLNGTFPTAKIEIDSGNISYNYSVIGAGIYAIGHVTMTGGTIEGNEGNKDAEQGLFLGIIFPRISRIAQKNRNNQCNP